MFFEEGAWYCGIMNLVQRISHDNKIDGERLILQKKFGGRGGRNLLNRFNRWLKPKQWAFGLMVFFGMAAYLLISSIQAL